jgi:outer membrane protein
MKRTVTTAVTFCLFISSAPAAMAAQPTAVYPRPAPVAPPVVLPPQLPPAAAPGAGGMTTPPPIYLSLKEAIALAVQRNLDVKVELYNPAIAEAQIRSSLGIYDPLFTVSGNYARNNTPSTSNFTLFARDQGSLNAGVSQLLPTGGTVSLTGDNSWVSDSIHYYSTGANLAVSQPLLRNFGRDVTELNIAVARYNKEGSLDRFRTKLSDTVAQVRRDYFQLYNLRENLEVQRTSLALANKILEETRGRVRAGVLPAMEILSAEFGASTREKGVIDAERAVSDQMDVLRLELQIDPTRELVIVDQPTRENYPVTVDEALALAMQNRPELAAQRVAVQTNELQQRVAKNRTLPDLTVNANIGTAGFASRYSRAYEKTINAEDPVWGVGVQFSYPIGNHTAENEYVRTKLAVEQAQTQLQSLEAGITNDVKAAIRLVASSYKQLDVTSRGTAYAEERLRAFRKRNSVGLATTKDVIDVENDLVAAQGAQIQAVVDYNNAITQLWRVTGDILPRQGITVTDEQADPLYQRAK